MSASDRRSDIANPAAWVVHKFGGSSVADAQCFERVARILESPAFNARARMAVVLSACKGVTDELLQLVALAERRDEAWRARLAALRARHAGIAAALLDAPSADEYLAEFDQDSTDLAGVLRPRA